MFIKSIKTINHPILGNLILDFTQEWKIAETVIIAWENGTWKSTILEIISEFSKNSVDNNRDRNEKRIITFYLTDQEILDFNAKWLLPDNIIENELIFTIDYSLINDGNQIKATYKSLQEGKEANWDFPWHLLNSHNLASHFSTIYSQVGINYDSKPIETIKSSAIDQDIKWSLKSSPNLADEITQLLVDIDVQDAQDYQDYAKKHLGEQITEDKLSTRIRRFSNAFEFMFSNKRYKGISTENGSKQVIFKEFDRECNINQLSSWEKQIVFRGGFLLKNKNSLNGNIVLIDEPEISMHPNRQLKILDFYKSLFIDSNGEQTSQLIVVTHSPFIIHNWSRYNDKVITLSKNIDGEIIIDNPSKYFWFTKEEFVKNSFDLGMISNSTKNTIFVEWPTDIKYIKKAAELLWETELLENIDLEIIGLETPLWTINSNDDNLKTAERFLSSNLKVISHKFIILHDPENQIAEKDYEDKLFIRKMTQNNSNQIITSGIENLLKTSLIERAIDEKKECFKTNKIQIWNEQEITKISILGEKKQLLCDRICQNGNKDDFVAFTEIFNQVRAIV